MKEHFNGEGSTPKGESLEEVQHDRFPTNDELEAFEHLRNITIMSPYPIEDFARDPANPAKDEIEAMQAFNNGLPKVFSDMTFESYFGYPDPRELQSDVSADQPSKPRDDQ